MKNQLVDCRLRNLQHPLTFHIPTLEQIEALQPGDFVKLIFEDRERMWVKITSREGDEFTGVLNNDPVIVDMKCGDKVLFYSRHIASIWSDENG